MFGLPYDEGKYHATVLACELVSDINNNTIILLSCLLLLQINIQALPNGDQTEIGEKGINLRYPVLNIINN